MLIPKILERKDKYISVTFDNGRRAFLCIPWMRSIVQETIVITLNTTATVSTANPDEDHLMMINKYVTSDYIITMTNKGETDSFEFTIADFRKIVSMCSDNYDVFLSYLPPDCMPCTTPIII